MQARNQDWALNQIRNARNSFVLMLASCHLLKNADCGWFEGRAVLLNAEGVMFDPTRAELSGLGKGYHLDLSQIATEKLCNSVNFGLKLESFFKFCRRNLVKEAYEAAIAYHRQLPSNKHSRPESEDWYPYAHVIRNAMSHDMRIAYSKGDKNNLPITWENVRFNIDDDGTELTGQMVNPLAVIRLLDAIEAYVKRTT